MRSSTIVAILLASVIGSPVFAGENYALLVGVGDYDEKELRPLKYSRADVIEFQAALIEAGFAPKNVVVLHDDTKRLVAHYESLGTAFKPQDYLPEHAKIRRELALLLGRLQKDDSVIVAFAGHGVQFKSGKQSYFCPLDAKLSDPKTLIAFSDVYDELKDCAAGRKMLLIDACQNDPQSELARSRATVELESVTRPQTEAVPEGIVALFSCRAGQKSFEHPPLGHGIFFHHVLEGWNGKADVNADGKLSYQELASYAERQTAEYAAQQLKVLQTPQLRTEFSGNWILREIRGPSSNEIRKRVAKLGGKIVEKKHENGSVSQRIELTDVPCPEEDFARIVELKGLTELSIYKTDIRDAALRHLRAAPELSDIGLMWCFVSDPGIRELKSVPKLDRLFLMGLSGVTDDGLLSLRECPGLRSLSLDQMSSVSDRGLSVAKDLKKLESLFLHKMTLSNATATLLRSHPALDSLNVAYCQVEPGAVREVFRSTSMSDVSFQACVVEDEDLIGIERMKKLNRLWLRQTRVTDAAIPSILKVTGLKVLDLSETAATDAGVRQLGVLTKLEYLYLPKGISQACADELQQKLPKCKISR